MARIIFFVDGFNLYHSILSIQNDTGNNYKWLNIKSLCYSYLPTFGAKNNVVGVKYFSAIPAYLSKTDPGKIIRHKLYIKCLQDTGIDVILGRFKEKQVYCRNCKSTIIKHEEKETDVSIAVTILDSFIKNECDMAIIITGDTDLSPVVKIVKSNFPSGKILFIFPYRRENRELLKICPESITIKTKSYRNYQFPDSVILKDSTVIKKPTEW